MAFYLRHLSDIEDYIAEPERLGDEIRAQIEAAFPPEGRRPKLARLES